MIQSFKHVVTILSADLIHFQILSHRYWQASVFCWVLAKDFNSLLQWSFLEFLGVQSGFSESEWSEKERETLRWKPQSFYNQISKVTYYHFCHMLLVTLTNSGTPWAGTTQDLNSRRYREFGIILKAAYFSWKLW